MATNAVATRGNTDVQPGGQAHPVVRFRGQLEQRAAEFKMVLPQHITPEKFQRTILTAAQTNPDILAADRQSLLNSCMKAAQDGLVPDGREAALVIFSTRQKINGEWTSVKQVQYMPMVYGLRKKILQSGEVKDIITSVVYRQEVDAGLFIYEEGTERTLRHKPLLDADFAPTDDDIVAAYSVATLNDGSRVFEVMPRRDINKVRQASQTGAVGKTDRSGKAIPPKGPWVDWFSEMAKKTVMRRHAKTLPMSSDIVDIEADEHNAAASVSHVLAAEPDAPEPIATLPSRGQLEEDHDPATGEVLDAEGDESAAAAAEPEEAVTTDAPLARADGQPGYQLDRADDWGPWLEEFAADIARAENVIAAKNLLDKADKGDLKDAPAEVRAEAERLRDARVEALKAGAGRP